MRRPADEALLTPHDVRRMLDSGVRRAVARAATVSPFYRKRLAGLPPIGGVSDLARAPFTTKADLADIDRLRAEGVGPVVDVCTTSGSTGTPTLFPLTAADLDRLGWNEALSFTCAGIHPGDTVILAVTLDRCFMAGLAYFEGLRRLGVTTLRIGSGSPAMLLDLLERSKATVIVSVPTFLRKVAAFAAMSGFDLSSARVRSVVCIGEPVRDETFAPTPLAARLAAAFGARVLSTWGMTELAASACECEAGLGGHLHPSLLHLETVDEAGEPVPDGVPGEVVGTSFGVEALPLVRFRTGDVAALYREPCPCGRATPRLGPILARRHQLLKIKGTSVYPAAVHRVLEAFEEVADFTLVVRTADALSDDLEVVVTTQADPTVLLPRLREQMRGALKVAPTVRVASTEEMDRLHGTGRKKQVFVDLRHRT